MENSSPSRISPASPIAFPPDAFGAGWVTLAIAAGLVVFVVPIVIGLVVWISINGFDTVALNRSLLGLFGIGLQSAGELAVIVFLIAILPAVARMPLRELGFRLPLASDVGKILVAVLLMFVLVTGLGSLLSSAVHFKSQELAVQVFTQMRGWQKILFAFFAVIVGPVWEEFVFRVFLFNAMRKWWGFWGGALVSSILFGLAHAQAPFTPAMLVALSLPLTIGGLVLCAIYVRTGSALANMITHAGFNLLSLVLITAAPQLGK